MISDVPAFVFSVPFVLRLAQGLVETVVTRTHIELDEIGHVNRYLKSVFCLPVSGPK